MIRVVQRGPKVASTQIRIPCKTAKTRSKGQETVRSPTLNHKAISHAVCIPTITG